MMSQRFLISLFVGLAVVVAAPLLRAAEHSAKGPSPAAEAPEGGAKHAASHAEGEAGLNPLKTWKSDLALFTLVVFVILLVILGKFAWRPIVHGLEQREKRIADDIAGAERANEDAKKILAEYQQQLARAELEVREILERGRRDAEQIGREIQAKAKAETEAEKERALREIDAATSGAIKEVADRSASLAVELAGKIVQAQLDPTAHRRLIDQAVDRFVQPGSANGHN